MYFFTNPGWETIPPVCLSCSLLCIFLPFLLFNFTTDLFSCSFFFLSLLVHSSCCSLAFVFQYYVHKSLIQACKRFSRIRSHIFQRVSPLTVFLFFELSRGRLHVPTHTKTAVLATLIFYVLISTVN